MDIGTLTIKMAADMAQLKRDMDDAKSSVGTAMADIERMAGLAKTALVALAGVGSVAAFANMIRSSIDATGALKDLAAQTGASEAALGAFRAMGAYTDTSIQSITGSMNKLSKNMVSATEDGKGTAAAIKALGINLDDFKSLNPEEQMLAVAKSMNGFADGADKGAAAQLLFGKEGAKLLPFLKDLGEQSDEITVKLTDQEKAIKKTQAAMADAFGDNLTQIRKESDAWKKDLATGMTPALYEASQAFLDVARGTGGLKGEISALSKDGTFTEWTRSATVGLTYVMDAFSGVATVAKSAGLIIGGLAAVVSAGDIPSMRAAMNALTEDLDKTWGEKTLGAKLRDRMAEIKAVGLTSEAIKPQLDLSGALAKNEAARKAATEAEKEAERQMKLLAAEAKKQKEIYDKLNSSIGEKTTAMELEMEQGKALTESQKIENKLLADMASSTVILTDAQLANTLEQINNLQAVEGKLEAYKLDKKATEESAKENANMRDKLEKSTDAINAQADQVRDHTAMLGLNETQLAALVVQKGYDEAATYDQKAAWAEQNMLGADLVQQYRDQATALRNLADLRAEGIHVKAAVEAAAEWQKTTDSICKGLGSALSTAVMSGKDIWLSFRDYMVKTIIDGVIKNAFASVISDGISMLTSMIGGMRSSVGSTVGSVAGSIGGASQLSSAGSVAGSVFSGGMSLANGAGTVAANAGYAGGGIDGLLATNGAFGTAATGGGSVAATVGAESAATGGTVATTVGTESAAAAGGVSGIGLGVVGIVALGALNSIFGASDVMTPDVWATLRPNPREVNDRLGVAGMAHPIFNTNAEFSAWSTAHGYASGGDHGGGLRIVGENGPELEATGPSRIFNAGQTQQILSGSGDSSGVVSAVQSLHQTIASMGADIARLKDILTRVTPKGAAVSVETVVIA